MSKETAKRVSNIRTRLIARVVNVDSDFRMTGPQRFDILETAKRRIGRVSFYARFKA